MKKSNIIEQIRKSLKYNIGDIELDSVRDNIKEVLEKINKYTGSINNYDIDVEEDSLTIKLTPKISLKTINANITVSDGISIELANIISEE